jgi:diketogulonate reductase-like aldo/keto reductase
MEYKTLIGDVRIPILGMGTWKLEGGYFPDRSQDKIAIETLREGIRLGMTHIDTAEMYGSGHVEEIVGEAIKPFRRKDVFITTKVSPVNLRFDDLVNSIKGSLKRLKTDFVDLYLIHWPNPKIPLKESMKALEYAVEEGFTKFIGVSNFSVELMKKAQSYTKEKIVANQVEYSLLHREPERDLLPYCQKENIMIIAYTPLAGGKLTKPGFNLLDEIANKYNRTQSQVVLNWLISKEKVITIPKTIKIQHLIENIGAIGWKLKEKDVEKLDKKSFGSPFEDILRFKKFLYIMKSYFVTKPIITRTILPAIYKRSKNKK